MTEINYDLVKETAQNYSEDMNAFLRDLILKHGESCEEGDKSKRIKEEMEKRKIKSSLLEEEIYEKI